MQRCAVIGEVKKHQNAIAWNSRNEDFDKTVWQTSEPEPGGGWRVAVAGRHQLSTERRRGRRRGRQRRRVKVKVKVKFRAVAAAAAAAHPSGLSWSGVSQWRRACATKRAALAQPAVELITEYGLHVDPISSFDCFLSCGHLRISTFPGLTLFQRSTKNSIYAAPLHTIYTQFKNAIRPCRQDRGSSINPDMVDHFHPWL